MHFATAVDRQKVLLQVIGEYEQFVMQLNERTLGVFMLQSFTAPYQEFPSVAEMFAIVSKSFVVPRISEAVFELCRLAIQGAQRRANLFLRITLAHFSRHFDRLLDASELLLDPVDFHIVSTRFSASTC